MPARLAVASQATPPTHRSRLDPSATVDVRYRLVADADPGMLPRLLEAFAKLGHAPSYCLARTVSGGTEFAVDLRAEHLAPRTAELIEFGLRRVLGVHHLVALVEPSPDSA